MDCSIYTFVAVIPLQLVFHYFAIYQQLLSKLPGPRIFPKNNGEKSVKSVKKYFYTVTATLNKGGKNVN